MNRAEMVKKDQEWAVAQIEEEERKRKRRKEVFVRLNDHELLQEVYDSATGSFMFILFDQRTGRFEILSEYHDPGQQVTYVPTNVPIGKNNLPRVILASEPRDYDSEAELLMRIRRFISKYVELRAGDLELISCFVLHSWVYDCSDYAMQVLVLGDVGSGKTRLLKVLRLICYNSLALSGGSSLSAYRRLEERFKGTLLINEFEPWTSSEDSNELILWLNNGFERDLPIALSRKKDPDKQDFFDPFCPKLLTSRNIIENVAAQSRLLIIKMERKARKDIPIELPPEAYEEAAELRNMLLMFRLKHHVEHYRLSPDLEKRLREDESISDRFKQNALPMFVLAEIAGLNVDEVFNFYRQANLEFKRRIATTTIEGVLFNTIIELCFQERFDEPEFYGFIDKDHRLVGVGTRLLEKKTGFSQKAIVKALQRMGMVIERRRKKVLIWNKDTNEPEEKERILRLWVFPSERAWREAWGRYYFKEPEPGGVFYCGGTSVTAVTPEVLKSQTFIAEQSRDACDACVATMEQICSDQSPASNILNHLDSVKDTVLEDGRQIVDPSISANNPVQNLDDSANDSGLMVELSYDLRVKLRRLAGYNHSPPVYARANCFICGVEKEQLWRAVQKGFSLELLCEDCFKLFLKHYGGL
ncbi:MAG: hypothetical protein QW491_13125 [Thermoproteota archaeon]|nr:hypothetical protein [Candidatus Brockarchaeota archaeon]